MQMRRTLVARPPARPGLGGSGGALNYAFCTLSMLHAAYSRCNKGLYGIITILHKQYINHPTLQLSERGWGYPILLFFLLK